MRRQQCWLLLIIFILQTINFLCISCRPVAVSNPHPSVFQLQHKTLSPEQGKKSMMEAAAEGDNNERGKEDYEEGKKMIGSRPPSCVNKCYGCIPCQAIQVPTTSTTAGVQYASYFPEGWKCKCGTTFYTP